ncbi:MAG: hypothetical protein JWM50_772 [Microbacteriaceae bacterium]|jgi:hypothetical protein|nr:hypothetical protein [Microbacteriaceae bacterium]
MLSGVRNSGGSARRLQHVPARPGDGTAEHKHLRIDRADRIPSPWESTCPSSSTATRRTAKAYSGASRPDPLRSVVPCCEYEGVTNQPDDREQELHDALQASHNSMLLFAMTVAFGVLWIAEPDRLPSWVASLWFILVIPLSLYLVFVYRRRYRRLRDE